MSERPNIVVVVLDSVRRDHLSHYGYHRSTTPNLDRVAADAVTFRNAYSASSWTIPSHASLFTGLYPTAHRADFDTRHLDSRHQTIAELAASAGYRTACFTANGFISHHTNLDHGFQDSVDIRRPGPFQKGMLGRFSRGMYRRWHQSRGKDRGSTRLTRLAERWLTEMDRETPFLLFLNYMDCHLPYKLRTPDRYRFIEPEHRDRADAVPQDPFATMASGRELSETELEDLQGLYDGALYHLDRQIGRLDEALRRLGLADDTILVVTSDHGESFGEHGLLDHQYGLYEHLIAVPLILRLPAGQFAGREISSLVQLTDVMPSVAEWIGVPVPAAAAGTTHPLLDEGARDWSVSEYLVPNLRTLRRRIPDVDVTRFDRAFRSIRDERHKLVLSREGSVQLFDLLEDPAEESDISSGAREVVDRLSRRLDELLGPWPDIGDSSGTADVDPELRERLEALGYL